MRITNQMLARTAAKTGIPLQQNTLLDIMNKSAKASTNPFAATSDTGNINSFLKKLNSKSNKELATAAESLSDYAEEFLEEGENSLFGKAQASGDTSELVAHITSMADAYNRTLKYIGGSDSALSKFYAQELKSYAAENSAALKAVGVSRNKDGSLSILQDALKAADVDSLRAAFGRASGFSEKVGYVGGRVAENAISTSASVLSGYDSKGFDYWDSFSKNKYDFWG